MIHLVAVSQSSQVDGGGSPPPNPGNVTVTGLTPKYGGTTLGHGDYAIITGTGFTGTPTVTMNSTAATSVTVDSATQITCKAPSGMTWGDTISVSVDGQTYNSSIVVHPAPNTGDTILFDARAGGADDLQAVTTQAQAQALFATATLGGADTFCSAAHNFLGDNRTQAIRYEMTQSGDCGESGPSPIYFLTGLSLSEVYMAWKWRMGRSATDTGGSSVGTVDYFQISNLETCNAAPPDTPEGRKEVMMNMSGSLTRFDLDFSGYNGGPLRVQPIPGSITGLGTAAIDTYTPRLMHFAYHFHAPTTARIWFQGAYAGGTTAGSWGSCTIDDIRNPSTMGTPSHPQTEYKWDFVIWRP